MKIPPVKGTRDFYPPVMAIRNFIVDGWKTVSVRNGFAEYDGPIFEYLKMFQVKSGDEIAEQLFSFRDRGDRDLAIRPEITPTLARMVNQQINTLPRPIKWFSVPRLCRAERPQKGRLREFFQWNIDIIGADSFIADAEVIFTSIDYLRDLGLGSDDIKAKISSRKLLAAFLKNLGIEQKDFDTIYPVLDKKPRLAAEAFGEMLEKVVPDKDKAQKIKAFMELDTVSGLSKILDLIEKSDEAGEAEKELEDLLVLLEDMGVGDYCEFDPGIVRGLAYYTGVVFEIQDAVGQFRAICGGGRYDNLLKDFGGPAVSGTGMGMGDCVLEILLREKGLPTTKPNDGLDYFIACLDEGLMSDAVAIAANLRSKGLKADFSYKSVALGKQLKQASAKGAGKCIIVGAEYADNKELAIKDMTTGEQETVKAELFLAELGS